MSDRNSAGRLAGLDALRGVAAFWVVLYHFTTRYEQLYGHPSAPLVWFPNGALAVHLFFVISGFVIFMTLERCRGAVDFAVSRATRLYPPYWAAVLLTFGVGTLFPLPDQAYTPGQLVANLTMLQSFLGVRHLDGVYWSLSWELGFYFVSMCLLVAGLWKRTVLVSCVWLCLELLVNTVLEGLGARFRMLFVLNYAHLFVAGIQIYQIWKGRSIKASVAVLAGCVVTDFVLFGGWHALLSAFYFGAVTLVVVRPPAAVVNRVFLWLGMVSYSLYLTHEMVGFKLLHVLYGYGVPTNLAVPVATAFALVLAWAFCQTFEQGATRWFRARYRGWVQQRLAA